MADMKQELNPTAPASKKRKTSSSSAPDLKPQSPSKAKKTDHRHTFFGPVQKSGAWTQEEDKKLFQHMYPRATGLNWEVIARDIEGRSLHDYFAFRTAEIQKVNARRLQPGGHDLVLAPRWKAVPLLRTCKILFTIAVQELYRDIVVLNGPNAIYNLMNGPTLHSHQHIRTLDLLNNTDDYSQAELDECIERRVFQSQILAGREYSQNLTSSADEVEPFRRDWETRCKPRLRSLAIKGQYYRLVTCLLRFFNIDLLTLHGWAPCVPFYKLPSGCTGDHVTHLVLHLFDPYDNGFCGEDVADDIFDWLETITISLGEIGREHEESWLPVMGPDELAEKCDHRISTALSTLYSPADLIFTPYLDTGDHRFCFPKEKPQDIMMGKMGRDFEGFGSIEFRSGCDCGQGDATRLWEAIEASIYRWLREQENRWLQKQENRRLREQGTNVRMGTDENTSGPKTALPLELVTQILQDYFAFRLRELHQPRVRHQNDDGNDVPQEAEWNALPLLLTCKRLSDIAMKELYRNVYLTSSEDTLVRLISRPPAYIYQYIETLNMMEVHHFCWDTLNESIAYRVVQSQGTALAQFGIGSRWTSLLEDAERFTKYWSSEFKPRLKTLICARGAAYWLSCLLKFFNIDQISVHYWQPYDPYPYLPGGYAKDSVKHLVLYLDEASELQPGSEQEKNDLFRTLETVTIVLGNHKQRSPFTPPGLPVGPDLLAARSEHLIGSILNEVDPLPIGNFEIIFSPYVETGYHEYCLPKKKPQGVKRGEGVFASVTSIEFRSECNCGQGDKNDLWKAVEATAQSWMKGRHLPEAADTE
ncbi:hypothetical protein HD553DRAFT_351095 [Filobasidium floriforme]|uniref:uncharacterized protein n=1 Tax=Filobasidium floriforme TaxID=5210 RepID=UPI001E8CD60E|nr:uncharacterized protein HD553DRAFT_351095 [Filobasidium floriforme]KAH8082770.1 hypothetical protein HD553DRAFT_351095 [Filobasidium floriforme]